MYACGEQKNVAGQPLIMPASPVVVHGTSGRSGWTPLAIGAPPLHGNRHTAQLSASHNGSALCTLRFLKLHSGRGFSGHASTSAVRAHKYRTILGGPCSACPAGSPGCCERRASKSGWQPAASPAVSYCQLAWRHSRRCPLAARCSACRAASLSSSLTPPPARLPRRSSPFKHSCGWG